MSYIWPGLYLIANGYSAHRSVAEEGYEPPDSKELRSVMRLFAVSLRRGRQYRMDIPYVLKYEDGCRVKPVMANFVLKRLKLNRLSEH